MAAKRKRESQEEIWETCNFFGSFIETRHDPRHIPPGDEKTVYGVHCFCGLIDSDGMISLLQQPLADRLSMYRSARKVGVTGLVEMAKGAAAAVKKAGLSPKQREHRESVNALLRPFEKRYYYEIRDRAYARLYRFICSSEAFIPYALNCARIEREGGNPFNPKEWTDAKMKAAREATA